jgi:hypothetical protein
MFKCELGHNLVNIRFVMIAMARWHMGITVMLCNLSLYILRLWLLREHLGGSRHNGWNMKSLLRMIVAKWRRLLFYLDVIANRQGVHIPPSGLIVLKIHHSVTLPPSGVIHLALLALRINVG